MQFVDQFGSGLSEYEYNQYMPKLRDYFVEYLVENKSHAMNMENLFKFEFTRRDIILSAEYYVIRNDSVKSKSAIDDFLIAINRFFEEVVNKKYPNQNLITIRPFTNLNKEVEKDLLEKGIELEERQANPPINEDQYKYIIKYLKSDKERTFKTKQVHIILKLLLLYGFSFDRIMNMKKENYCSETRTLVIIYNHKPLRSLRLELPYSLHKEIEDYFEDLNKNKNENDYLFVTRPGNQIKHDFPNEYLTHIKNEYFSGKELEKDLKNPFTPTGLAKYAVIKMILDGVNQSVILDLTGFKNEMYFACQEEVNEMKVLNRNRYINHMIRGIPTFDEL